MLHAGKLHAQYNIISMIAEPYAYMHLPHGVAALSHTVRHTVGADYVLERRSDDGPVHRDGILLRTSITV